MAKNTPKIKDIGQQLSESTEAKVIPSYLTPSLTPSSGQYYSEIQGRAPILDFTNIPTTRFGVERFQAFKLELRDGEFDGRKPVYGISDDYLDRVRFVGEWTSSTLDDGRGWEASNATSSDDYVEIVFYGTGINLLESMWTGGGYNNFEIYVDGVLANTVDNAAANVGVNFNGNSYNQHILRNMVSGLSLGLHTVKIQVPNGQARFYGFEVLTETTDINITPGYIVKDGVSQNIDAATTTDLDTFTLEEGTDQGKGGHVVVYLEDGQIKKAIKWVGSKNDLDNADFTESDLVKEYSWRQFGGSEEDGTSFGWGTLDATGTGENKTFTLDDGTTNLVGLDCETFGGIAGVTPEDATDYIRINFIGTGLSVEVSGSSSGSISDDVQVIIDGLTASGSPIGNFDREPTTDQPIVSGLPFGTHVVEFRRSEFVNNSTLFKRFKIYAPKKPLIPNEAIELGSYYRMADFVANNDTDVNSIAQGVMRKNTLREFNLRSAWDSGAGVNPGKISGFDIRTNGTSDILEYTFYGTGFEYRGASLSGSSVTLSLDSGAGFSSDFSGFTTNVYDFGGTASWTPGTGILSVSGGTTETGLTVEGLSLGLHTIRFTPNNTTAFIPEALDIIVPMYSYDSSKLLADQRTIGSNSLKSEISIPNYFSRDMVFTGNISLGKSRKRWQRRNLDADINSDSEILRFDGLTIGKTYTYKYKLNIVALGANDSVRLQVKQSLNTLTSAVAIAQARQDQSAEVTFTATSEDVYLSASAMSASASITAADSSAAASYAILIEEDAVETDEW